MLYSNVGIENGKYGTFYTDKDDNQYHVPFGNRVLIKRIYKDVESGEIKLTLEYEYAGETRTIDISRGQLQKGKLLELAVYGVDVREDGALVLAKELRNQEDNKTLEYIHHNLGWGTVETSKGKIVVFKTSTIDELNSTYVGKLNIESKGTFEKWREIINTHVINYTPMEVALTNGLSSVVHGYIATDVRADNLIISYLGDSSTGKTTAAQVGISTAGFPDLKEMGSETNNLMTTWFGTQNAILEHVAGNNGLPVLFDELNMCKIPDLTDIMYTFSSGKEKGRLGKDLTLRNSANFCTTVLSTSETSILSRCNQNTGLKIRVIEFKNVQWTKSAEHSEQILNGILHNYGHAAGILAKYIKSLDKDDVLDAWAYWRNKYIESVPEKDQFTERISKQYATILLTAVLANKAFGINLNLGNILNFLVSNISYDNMDIGVEAYEYLLQQLAVQYHKFGEKIKNPSSYRGTQFIGTRGDILGILEDIENPVTLPSGEVCYERLVIEPTAFKNLMSEGGFGEVKIILDKFKAKGLLDFDKKCLTRKRRIVPCGNPIRTYVINLIYQKEDSMPDEPPITKKRSIVKKKVKPIPLEPGTKMEQL